MTSRLLRSVLLLLPAIVLVILAVPRFFSGLALDATFPVPNGMTSDTLYSQQQYAETAALLALADSQDGETQIIRAEALWHLKQKPTLARNIAWQSLAYSPASMQGWILLSEILSDKDPAYAAKALAVALELSPYDRWFLARRARAGAGLWERLPGDLQDRLKTQTRYLWSEENLRPQIRSVLKVEGGAPLMSRAIGNRSEIRALNRYLTRQRMGLK